MARRIMRAFKLKEISGVDRPAQEPATARIMKRAPEADGFNASGSGPMHDELRARFDDYRRGWPHLSGEQHFAMAWNRLTPTQRNQIRAEETPEWHQQQKAEVSRLRESARSTEKMSNNIDQGALAMFVMESAAEELRKREPQLTPEQAFAKIYTDPAYRVAAKAERAASRARLAGVPVARTAAHILNSLGDDAIHALVDEIRRDNPHVSDAELVRMIANSAEMRSHREEFRDSVRLATLDGERVPSPADVSIEKCDSALAAIKAKAAELRKVRPGLTEEQAFAKVYSDPANRALAVAERSAARMAIGA